MLLFHCSQAAAEGLSITRKGKRESWISPTPSPTVLNDVNAMHWHLHQVTIARQRVWVAMEQQSRFAMVLWGFKKGEGETLLHCFYERLINHLIWSLTDLELMNDQQAEQLLPPLLEQLSPFHFVTGSDRSVQAHITDVVQVCRIAVSEQGCLPNNQEQAADFDQRLNQTPRTVRGGPYLFPDERLLCDLLERLAGHHHVSTDAAKAALTTARRAYFADISGAR